MSFLSDRESIPFASLRELAERADESQVTRALEAASPDLADLAALLSPVASDRSWS